MTANAVVVFSIQFAYSPDQPDRGLTSIDHCDSFRKRHCEQAASNMLLVYVPRSRPDGIGAQARC